jgi:hypothetical protein
MIIVKFDCLLSFSWNVDMARWIPIAKAHERLGQ